MPHKVRVDVVLRSDALEKPGGDSLQIEKYRDHLASRGFDFALIPFRPDMALREGSIVHIVNVDRPFDFLATIRMAAERRIVVSSIHHDLDSVRMMRAAEKGQGIRSFAGRVLPESLRELLAFAVRSAKRVDDVSGLGALIWSVCWSIPRALTVWTAVGDALDAVHAVTLLAEGERSSLIKDTQWKGLNGVLIPNGLPDAVGSTVTEWDARDNDVCMIGRIEPRKRQLEVAQAARRSGIGVKFIGSPSPSSLKYVAEFADVVADNPNLEWCGPLDHSDVMDVIGSSRVLLNASWVEVQSLVDIEGAAAGCWVVVGNGGNSKEWLDDSIVAVDSYDVDVIWAQAVEVLKNRSEPSKVVYKHTWASAADSLDEIYRGISTSLGPIAVAKPSSF